MPTPIPITRGSILSEPSEAPSAEALVRIRIFLISALKVARDLHIHARLQRRSKTRVFDRNRRVARVQTVVVKKGVNQPRSHVWAHLARGIEVVLQQQGWR